MLINAKNTTQSTVTLNDLGGFSIESNATINLLLYFKTYELSNSTNLLELISDGSLQISDETVTYSSVEAIKFVTLQNVLSGPKDRSGKFRVHQTSRPLGTVTYFTGAGDNPDTPTTYGEGNLISINHALNDPLTQSIYVDFNCIENTTYVHEGYIFWQNAYLDRLTLKVVPRTITYTTSTNTNYNIYGGYLVIPAAGNGTVNITSDLTLSTGGLVEIPNDDLGNTPIAYWNATWNTSTKRFENITAAPSGNGRYNMFSVEVTLARFINKAPLIGMGQIMLESSDVDAIGHGMRFKVTTETIGEDHAWAMGGLLTLHRAKKS